MKQFHTLGGWGEGRGAGRDGGVEQGDGGGYGSRGMGKEAGGWGGAGWNSGGEMTQLILMHNTRPQLNLELRTTPI